MINIIIDKTLPSIADILLSKTDTTTNKLSCNYSYMLIVLVKVPSKSEFFSRPQFLRKYFVIISNIGIFLEKYERKIVEVLVGC